MDSLTSHSSVNSPSSVTDPPPADKSCDVSHSAVTHAEVSGWRRVGLCCINIWLVLHLIAITTAPATVGPSSGMARAIWNAFSPYLQLLHLNHGYHYFAPEPGSSHLVSWMVTQPDGSTASGTFPNFDIRPRLMYHRHFMLSEFLGNADPELQQILAEGYAAHLLQTHQADTVSLAIVRHDIPTMERIRAGGLLEDSDLYSEFPLGEFGPDGVPIVDAAQEEPVPAETILPETIIPEPMVPEADGLMEEIVPLSADDARAVP